MARIKLSEFRAKNLLAAALNATYNGQEIHLNAIPDRFSEGLYVAKVDQAIKKRNKLGLIRLNCNQEQVMRQLEDFRQHGYEYGLVEQMVTHEVNSEHFIAFERVESGIQVSYARQGGIDIEERPEDVRTFVVSQHNHAWETHIDDVDAAKIEDLYNCFDSNYMSYLEINPFIVQNDSLIPLDAAAEVDSAAEFMVRGAWHSSDFRSPIMSKTDSERKVDAIQAKSPASFSLRVLNPDGSIFLLLSGGGASVVLADELTHVGLLNELANYGEYSGNPNDDETYGYTLALIELLKASNASHKILLIAGGVANFTNISKTFSGIIRALSREAEYLKEHNVHVYVRRGGPYQAAGLAKMASFLDSLGLVNEVRGPDLSLGAFIESVNSKERSL